MKDVKDALEGAAYDAEAAFELLRKKGLASAKKKGSRLAAEGLVGVHIAEDQSSACILEVNSETDFVARNEKFQSLVARMSSQVHSFAAAASEPTDALVEVDMDAFKHSMVPAGDSSERVVVEEAVAEVAAVTGENVQLRRASVLRAPPPAASGTVSAFGYVHSSPPGVKMMGRIASVVLLAHDGGGATAAAAAKIGPQLAMHVVAARPQYLSSSTVPLDALEKEKAFLLEQAMSSGKPQNIAEKMVQGRLSKFYEEVALLEQKFVVDESKKVKAVIADAAKEAGGTIELVQFARMQCGEGLSD
mmetsp:Transcript_7282/g.26824  ORF Transcript_7282/g.26824 Transcript_7282/m.26824 type:complete len:304 (-) Transcript_7282:26-937(-)